jgi:hypothetical protein
VCVCVCMCVCMCVRASASLSLNDVSFRDPCHLVEVVHETHEQVEHETNNVPLPFRGSGA